MTISNSGAGASGTDGDWIRLASDAVAFERMEAFFSRQGYVPHRHDTYAIGRTLFGVQSFHYRGAARSSVPGATMVLHPDEVHDGWAGSAQGFLYRMSYIRPADIQQVLGGRPLPFIEHGISHDPRLFAAVDTLMRNIADRIDVLEYEDAIYDLARALESAAGAGRTSGQRVPDYRAAERARSYLHTLPSGITTLKHLEVISGQDRWTLSRDFRALFGTSPYRYLVLRRLEQVKANLRTGSSPARAALLAGFADQSHMTRHFTKTYGISPSRWLRTLAG